MKVADTNINEQLVFNEQCLKSADNKFKTININADIVDTACSNPIMAENIQDVINSSNSILLIASCDIPENVYDYVFSVVDNKKINIISENIPLKYSSYQVIFSKDNISDFEFFGASAGRAPMLIHKDIYNYDLIIVISSVSVSNYGGFLGSITTLFNNIVAKKTMCEIIKYALQDALYSIEKIASGKTIRNSIYESIRGGLITAGKAINAFAINIPIDYKNTDERVDFAFAGDLFLSQIEAQNVIDKKSYKDTSLHDKLRVDIECFDNIACLVTLIGLYCKKLKLGGRLFLDISNLSSFGNSTFQSIFNRNTLHEIVDNINEENYPECFYAFILKYYALNYHIALPYNEALNQALIQAGLNPLENDKIDEFIK